MKKRANEKGKSTSKCRAQKRVRRNGTSSIALESIDEVIQSWLKDGEEAEADEDGSYTGRDPEDIGGGSPGEDEKAGAETYAAEHHWWESGFWDGMVACCFEALEVEFLVQHIGDCSDQDAE